MNNYNTSQLRLVHDHKANPVPLPDEHHQPIDRHELIQRFSQAQTCRLTLVHAPMGYGKTTLLKQFLTVRRQQQQPCHWLTLSERDNDINQFARRIEQALTPSDASQPQHNAVDRLDSIVPNNRFSLFLDEFEVISNEGGLSFTRELIRRLPSGSELIIGSRVLPAIGIPRLRSQKAVLEITAQQLCLTAEEIQHLVKLRSGCQLNGPQVALLQQKSAGWAAFISLLSRTLRPPLTTESLLARIGSGRASMQSLINEHLLCDLPEDTRQFLRESSMLGEFDAALCDHALERRDSSAIIEQLERRQLFIQRLQPGHDSYRYHSLFANILQQHLTPQRRQLLHQRAAQWYLMHERKVLAIHHFLQAGQPAPAVDLIEQISPQLLGKGRARLLLRWLEQLPVDSVQQHADLTLTHGWALSLNRRYQEARQQLSQLMQQQDLSHRQRHEAEVIQALGLCMIDRTRDAISLIEQQQTARKPSHPLHDRVNSLIRVYGLIAHDEFAAARQILAAGQARTIPADDQYPRLLAYSLNAAIDLLQGQLSTALGQLSTRQQQGDTSLSAQHYRGRSLNDVTLALALYERNELESCQQLLSDILPLITENGTPDQLIYAHLLMARIHTNNQEYALANEYLDELDALSYTHSIARLSSSAWLGRAWLRWRKGDRTEAQHAYRRAMAERAASPHEPLVVYQHDCDWPAMMAWRLGAEESANPSLLQELQAAIVQAQQRGRIRRSHELQLLLARAQLNAGNSEDRVLTQLEPTLRHAIEQGYSRLFLDEGPQLCQLVLRWCETSRAILRSDMGHDPQLEHFMEQLQQGVATDQRQAQQEVALSSREMDVLKVLATGLRNQDIAAQLFVSESTVRTHLRNISAKLGARSRAEVVSIARNLKLL